MFDTVTKLFGSALGLPEDELQFLLSIWMSQIFPDKYVLETGDGSFDLKHYVALGRCSVSLDPIAYAQLEAAWLGKGRGGSIEPRNALYDVVWRGERLKVLSLTYGDSDYKRH